MTDRPSTYADADQRTPRQQQPAAARPASTFATADTPQQPLTRPDVAWAAHLATPKTGYRLDSAEDITVVVEAPVVLHSPVRVALEPARPTNTPLRLAAGRWHGDTGHRRVASVSFRDIRPATAGRYTVVVDVGGVRVNAGKIAVT